MIDKSMRVTPSITLAEQSTRILRSYFQENYQNGGQVPGEHELSELLGVNRNTVRQALKVLEQDGLILRKRGSGTFVNKHALGLGARLEKFAMFSDVIRNAGYEPTRVQVDWGTIFASEEAASKLDVDNNALLVSSRILYLADKKPAAYLHSCVPAKHVKDMDAAMSTPVSMYDFIADQCGTRVAYSTSEVIPRVCGEEYARIFEMDPASAILELKDLHYTDENYPILLTNILVKDPIIRFHAVRVHG